MTRGDRIAHIERLLSQPYGVAALSEADVRWLLAEVKEHAPVDVPRGAIEEPNQEAVPVMLLVFMIVLTVCIAGYFAAHP